MTDLPALHLTVCRTRRAVCYTVVPVLFESYFLCVEFVSATTVSVDNEVRAMQARRFRRSRYHSRRIIQAESIAAVHQSNRQGPTREEFQLVERVPLRLVAFQSLIDEN